MAAVVKEKLPPALKPNKDTVSEDVPDTTDDDKCPFSTSTSNRCDYNTKYRSFDGSCNNLDNPLWGRANMPLRRLLHPNYADGTVARAYLGERILKPTAKNVIIVLYFCTNLLHSGLYLDICFIQAYIPTANKTDQGNILIMSYYDVINLFMTTYCHRITDSLWRSTVSLASHYLLNPAHASHGGVSYFAYFVCVCACLCVCLWTRYLKKYLNNQIHFWWEPSLWPREETIRLWKKSPRGKGGPGCVCLNLALTIRDRRKLFEWL